MFLQDLYSFQGDTNLSVRVAAPVESTNLNTIFSNCEAESDVAFREEPEQTKRTPSN